MLPRDCPLCSKNEGIIHGRDQPYPSSGHSGLGTNAPKQNRFYALQTSSEKEYSLGVVTRMLKVF